MGSYVNARLDLAGGGVDGRAHLFRHLLHGLRVVLMPLQEPKQRSVVISEYAEGCYISVVLHPDLCENAWLSQVPPLQAHRCRHVRILCGRACRHGAGRQAQAASANQKPLSQMAIQLISGIWADGAHLCFSPLASTWQNCGFRSTPLEFSCA